MTSKAVTKKQNGAVAAVPAFMKDDAGRGMENLKGSDYEMPRVKLIQGISPELTTYDGLKSGDFFHTLTETSLGRTLEIVPIFISTRYVLWNPLESGGGILARADDAVHWEPPDAEFKVKIDKKGREAVWRTAKTVRASGLANWGTFDPSDPKSPPAATMCYVVVAALPDYPECSPVAILLQRAAVGPAKKFLGKINISLSRASIYGLRFIMGSHVENGSLPNTSYNAYTFTAAGFVEDQEQYEQYRQMHEIFKQSGVNVKDFEDAAGEGVNTGAGASAADKAAASGVQEY